MAGISLPAGVFVSSETIAAAMTTGYAVSCGNMIVKDTLKAGVKAVFLLGLSSPELYDTNSNIEDIKENASYDNNESKVKAEILAENKARGAAFEQQKLRKVAAQ